MTTIGKVTHDLFGENKRTSQNKEKKVTTALKTFAVQILRMFRFFIVLTPKRKLGSSDSVLKEGKNE
jgi:hypothetical protein